MVYKKMILTFLDHFWNFGFCVNIKKSLVINKSIVVPFTALRVNENRVFNPNNKFSCFTQYINNNSRGSRYITINICNNSPVEKSHMPYHDQNTNKFYCF